MKTTINLLILICSINLFGQLPIKIDYNTDLYMACDSIVVYEYPKVSDEYWSKLDASTKLDSLTPKYKKVYYYKDETLYLEKNFSMTDIGWSYSSKVEYDIKGSDVIETTSAILGDKEVPFTETYNLDYLWVTDIAAIDVLSKEDARKFLTDPSIKSKFNQEIKKNN